MKTALVYCFLMLGLHVLCLAQPGIGEMQQARGFLQGSFFSFRSFSMVLSALIAIIGAVEVYGKWQHGKDISTDLPAWFFAALFVLLMGSFLNVLFGI